MGDSLLCEGAKIYTNGLGHMTEMATMPIHGKSLKIFSRTYSPMILKCVVLFYALISISGERLQDHRSSGIKFGKGR